MAELLLELLSEEIPARMQAKAADDLKRLVEDGLKKAGLAWDKSEAFAGPRRLALVIDGLPEKTPDIKDERKGPQVGAPEQAVNGFLKSLGGLTLDDCEQREIKGKTFYVAVIDKKGMPLKMACEIIISDAIIKLSWPKSMRWGVGKLSYVRPLHNVLALFNGEIVSPVIGYGNGQSINFSNETFGHRFLSPGPIAVNDFADYQSKLKAAHVMLSAADRRAEIVSSAEALAESAGLTLKPDEGLLREVTGLVEWPVVMMGDIDAEYMELPGEVLSATMKLHQKFFSLLNPDGTLAPKFVVVSNQVATDGGAAIIAGNQRVLRARLSDAKFFWDADRRVTLSLRAPALKDIVFHAKLGTLDEKIDRVQALAVDLAQFVPGSDKDQVRSAARLAKCDLVTGMVAELPELQGIMGRYYALEDGEGKAVADAIRDHYAPLGPSDTCPKAPVSVAVALADKIDTLVGFWTIDEKPTGSKDPFALRRAALGVIRLIVENNLRLSLIQAIATSYGLIEDPIDKGKVRPALVTEDGLPSPQVRDEGGATYQLREGFKIRPLDEVSPDLLSFFTDRLKVHLKSEGVRHDLIDAVMAKGDEDDLVRLLARVDALSGFVATDDGANLLAAHKRAANILKIEEKKDKTSYRGKADAKLLDAPQEKALHTALQSLAGECAPLIKAEKFKDAMSGLAKLRAPVDAFFDDVTVNADDAALRQNRLMLLSEIQATMDEIADFSKIEG